MKSFFQNTPQTAASASDTRAPRLLAILGSPRPEGNVASMLQICLDAARSAGYETETVDLYQESLSYCRGCNACMTDGHCVLPDGIERIAGLLRDCDVVILAAPVYWANVPACVKNLFDRLRGCVMRDTAAFPKPLLSRSQRYLLLTACNTPAPFAGLFGQSSGALRAMNEFFRTAGMRRMGQAVFAGTRGKTQLPRRLVKKLEGCFSAPT